MRHFFEIWESRIELTAGAEGLQKTRALTRLTRQGSKGCTLKTAVQP